MSARRGRNSVLRDFKEFAMRGPVIDMAVGIIIGAAFGTVVASLVADVIMPPVGLLLGGVDFSQLFIVLREGATPGPYASLAEAQRAGAVTLRYGTFFNTLISFLTVAFAVFLLVRGVNRMRRREEAPVAAPTTKACPYCLSQVALKATRCAFCTAELKG
jgi:large conductance mechanosensitive channel